MTISFSATYSPEDNKLRIYASSRLDKELFARFKELGFRWAPKQELFVAPRWTPTREDFCIELAGSIDPEETTMVERAEAKIERIEGYMDKAESRANSFHNAANAISERFAFGQPILIGHHSERGARKDQERIHNNMSNAVNERNKIGHYNWKIGGVVAHANRKANTRTRLNRIKGLLAELRDLQRTLNDAQINLGLLNRIKIIADKEEREKAVSTYVGFHSVYPGSYCALRDGEITHEEVVEKCIENNIAIINGPKRKRWILHILNRLGYERSELGEVSLYEGELTPALLQVFTRTHGAHKPKATRDGENWKVESTVDLPLHIGGGEKVLSLSPAAWCELMQGTGYEVPTAAPKKPLILNFKASTIEAQRYGRVVTYPQLEMTKEEYSKKHTDYKRIHFSTCGTFRFRTCIDHSKPGCHGGLVAVFLTNSKVHPTPESNSIVLEEVKDIA